MGTADPNLLPATADQHLLLHLERNEEDEGDFHLTCWFCNSPAPCEWTTTFRLDGSRRTVGVHERCRHVVRTVKPR